MRQSRDLIVCRKFRVPVVRMSLERMAYVRPFDLSGQIVYLCCYESAIFKDGKSSCLSACRG